MRATLIGVDCATEEGKVGLTLAEYDGGMVALRDVAVGSRSRRPADIVLAWLSRGDTPQLLALDAPLGWPAPLAPALTAHRAGVRIDSAADDLFQRTTDRFVHDRIGKRPFDVGADRIARTAHAALCLLGELSDKLGTPIPLFWQLPLPKVAALEVYPAATLIAHGYRCDGYKKPAQVTERRDILNSLSQSIRVDRNHRAVLEADANALDAGVCVLAASDVLGGKAMIPEDRVLAEREGWIWVAPRRREA
jgi:hypothetical protein